MDRPQRRPTPKASTAADLHEAERDAANTVLDGARIR
jgi:hypothetical protein